MLLGCENTERTINFAIDGEHIEQTQSIKILGVHIDEKLTFGENLNGLQERALRAAFNDASDSYGTLL